LQLGPGFGFYEAAGVVGYLAELGVSHVYLSPVLQAAPGSTHGYDVVDHARVSEALGGAGAHRRLVEAIAAAGLGQVLDIVPNHMAITGPENRWWWDVLENGPSSRWAGHFDVTWDPPEEKLRNTVVLPILGDHYGRALDRGEIRLDRDGAAFTVRYFDHTLPVDPRSLGPLLADAAAAGGDEDLVFLAAAFRRLPRATRTDAGAVAERHRDAAALRRMLGGLLAERPALAGAVDGVVAETNADPAALDRLLDGQNYRMAFWRTGRRELGYRRFFDIDTLAGLRMEDPEVFADTHELVLRWVAEGVVSGLRIDHPDGLRDPAVYFERLAGATGGVWTVAEKILEPGEDLPAWPVAGTTGYDRLGLIGGLFVDPAGEGPLTEAYGQLTGAPTDVAVVVHEARELAVRELLAADLDRLTALLVEVCEGRRHQRDRTRDELHEAVAELAAAFAVYRTYVRAEAGLVAPRDAARIDAARDTVAEHRDDIDPDLLAFLADLLALRLPGRTPLEDEWVMRFQQLTGPAMAKGVEDTAFYRYTRLLALNEVGGDPSRFGVAVDEFHAANAAAQDRWPGGMTALSTHDTKRSADVRARLALLSEIPGPWAEACGRWMAASAPHWAGGEPDRHAQHLLFQTLVGAWPLGAERAVAYLAKATKEAKLRTSWTRPDPDYDTARDGYGGAVLADAALMAGIEAFVAPLVAPGRVNALAQVALQLTVPGVPDTYRGDELWDLSLVDPDNRRPVDFERRRRLLAGLDGLAPGELMAGMDEGLPKLALVRAVLHLRRRRPHAFGPGEAGAYVPLPLAGPAAAHGVAFTRGGTVAVVVPRLVLGLEARGGWDTTAVALPPGPWADVVTGATVAGGPVPVGDLVGAFPVAVLEAAPP
jgi:(1->4)-alpha-D-glucan 1-alpha-D-glucosylmutase